MKKAIPVYSIILGAGIIGLWIMILSTDGMPEGPVESTFHLISEFLMAAMCLAGGILSFFKFKTGRLIMIIAHGMVLYSVLNAAGYYGQGSGMLMALPFVALAIISAIILYHLLGTHALRA